QCGAGAAEPRAAVRRAARRRTAAETGLMCGPSLIAPREPPALLVNGDHHRDIAGRLRQLARLTRSPGIRRELMDLAKRYDRRGVAQMAVDQHIGSGVLLAPRDDQGLHNAARRSAWPTSRLKTAGGRLVAPCGMALVMRYSRICERSSPSSRRLIALHRCTG